MWIAGGLRDTGLLRDLGQSGFSLTFNINIDRNMLPIESRTDPAMVGAAIAVVRLQQLWEDVNDRNLWNQMMGDLFDLVIDEWETTRREQGPWKEVFDSHVAIGRRRGWLSGLPPVFAEVAGKSTAQLAKLNEDLTSGAIKLPAAKTGGCYIATAVYGSYDCPEVWVLRRFRDRSLASTQSGRLVITAYYAVSPRIVRVFGRNRWFAASLRPALDWLVAALRCAGFEQSPYKDADARSTMRPARVSGELRNRKVA